MSLVERFKITGGAVVIAVVAMFLLFVANQGADDDGLKTVRLPAEVYNKLEDYKFDHHLSSMWKAVDLALDRATLYEISIRDEQKP